MKIVILKTCRECGNRKCNLLVCPHEIIQGGEDNEKTEQRNVQKNKTATN